jgi:FlaA1/EpsC-like NDP-sugar epimerase
LTSKQRNREITYFGLADYVMAMFAWAMFFVMRKMAENVPIDSKLLQDKNLYTGLLVIPIGWVLFYAIFDQYTDIYRKSRLKTFAQTFFLSFLGVLFLFFTLILDDVVFDYRTYYQSFLALFGLHFLCTAMARMVILTRASRRLKSGLVSYNTIIIGSNQNAVDLYNEIKSRKKGLGNRFLGFLDLNENANSGALQAHLLALGDLSQLDKVIEEHQVEEVIIAIETSEHSRLQEILHRLFDYDERILVKIIPDMYDILLGSVKMNHVFGAVLIEIRQDLMPKWQRYLKRLIDIAVSATFLLLLSPIILYIMIRVRLSSRGPIFFAQERVGLHNRLFTIFKFRSMFVDAEAQGPRLAADGAR